MKGKNTRNSISMVETKGKLGSSEIPIIEYLVFRVFSYITGNKSVKNLIYRLTQSFLNVFSFLLLNNLK